MTRRDFYLHCAIVVLSIVCANVIIMAMSGNSPFMPNIYNPYALQAQRWLAGYLDLGRNYEHLEIAMFGGRYFVSFPPFPSMVLLPFALFLGHGTPDHFITLFAAAAAGVFAFKLALRFTGNAAKAVFYSLFLCIGSNVLFLTNTGYVWFMAQTFAFSLTIMAFYYATKAPRKPGLALFLFCCAMGCRPLNAVFLPLLFLLLYDKDTPILIFVKNLFVWAIPAIAMGAVFAALNYFRFGNIFEFGHSYLPEFVMAEHGQFSRHHLWGNFLTLWRLPWIEHGRLRFHEFNGTAFWLVSPIFLTYAATYIRHITGKKKSPLTLIIPAFIAAHILIICTHRTMGGWHFGHRYTVDALPVAYLGLVRQDKDPASLFSLPLLLWGLGVNIAGTVSLYLGMA